MSPDTHQERGIGLSQGSRTRIRGDKPCTERTCCFLDTIAAPDGFARKLRDERAGPGGMVPGGWRVRAPAGPRGCDAPSCPKTLHCTRSSTTGSLGAACSSLHAVIEPLAVVKLVTVFQHYSTNCFAALGFVALNFRGSAQHKIVAAQHQRSEFERRVAHHGRQTIGANSGKTGLPNAWPGAAIELIS